MPPTAEEYIAKYQPGIADHFVMREFPKMVQNALFGQHLLGMRWTVLRVEGHPFLISDEPVVMQTGLAKPGGHLAMPLMANSMPLATYDEATFREIERKKPHRSVKTMNKFLVQRASKFVGARDSSQEAFIRKAFWDQTCRYSRLVVRGQVRKF
ncbi:MAG: DUF4238 domain-containing protein [Parasphingorhabdus sp.]